MKKFFTLVSACLMAFAANAQDKLYLSTSDQNIEINLDDVEEISFSHQDGARILSIHDIIGGKKYQGTGNVYFRLHDDVEIAVDFYTFGQVLFEVDNEVAAVKLSDYSYLWAPVTMEMVDLGLSVKWGAFNLGAITLVDKGNEYKFGQVDPEADYPTVPFGTGTYVGNEELYSYFMDIHGHPGSNYDGEYGITGTEFDAAHVTLGNDWRMPTHSEWNELKDNCTWEKVTLDGIEIMKITSKIEGYTDKFIYLPLVSLSGEKPSRCIYWTANPSNVGGKSYGTGVCIPSSTNVVYSPATTSFPLRPVYGKSNRPSNNNKD